MHLYELVGEDCSNCVLVVHVMWEGHLDGVGGDVRVFSQMDSCEVLVVDEDMIV